MRFLRNIKDIPFKHPILLPLVIIIIAIIIADACLPVVFLRNHYTKHLQKDSCFKYLIIDTPKETPKNYSYTAKIIGYYDYDSRLWKTTGGKIKIYVPKYNKDSVKNTLLQYGDVIVSTDKLQPIVNLDSSSDFNYVKYMRHKRIYHQVFIHSFRVIDTNQANIVVAKAKQINTYLSDRIQSLNMGDRQRNLAVALLLGDKRDLDGQTRHWFTASGLAHILCVSGLHIMMILLAVSSLLKKILPYGVKGIYIRNILLIFLAWCIALIVGFTPSALRVATMLTLLIISRFTPLNGDSADILLTTAFIFLCFDPLLLFNISFQLSFLAVAGIIWIKQDMNNLLVKITKAENYYLKGILSNISTTFSAQLLCVPVILYNFGRFPMLFILSNLIVIPFLQFILLSLIVLLLFCNVPLFGSVLVWLCDLEMTFVIKTAQFMSLA